MLVTVRIVQWVLMSDKIFAYEIETDIPDGYMKNLMGFVRKSYIDSQRQRFRNLTTTVSDGSASLAFGIVKESGEHVADVEIRGGKPLKLKVSGVSDADSEHVADGIREDVTILANLFEDNVRKSTLYFAWTEGKKGILPEKLRAGGAKSLNRIFLETQILFFMLFILISAFLLPVITWFTPIVLLAVQFVFVLFSSKLIARTADWRITKENPTVHLLEYHLPMGEHESFKELLSKVDVLKLKKEIYDRTIAERGEIDCRTVQELFGKFGLPCNSDNLVSRKVNAYELVQNTATRYGFPMPEIVVSNTMLPNAAASGPSPSHGIVLMTSGLFVELDDEEITSVLGHEFGHLKGRDPLYLFGLTGLQYLFMFYVLFPYISSNIILFFVYLWASLTFIFFVAKFFEARADLLSAMVIGKPKVLARALERIGFKRLLYERVPMGRIQEWLGLDPHPPIYFRISRLRGVQTPAKIKHPLLQSAKDVVRGFISSL
jgi:heat shock protein HtpX